MPTIEVAIVTRDPRVRELAARAFDGAPSDWRVALFEEPPAQADVIVIGSDMQPIDGAIALDESDLAAATADVARSLRSKNPQTVVVTGASGGVGITSVALHLCCRSARDRSTCYIDLDPSGGACDRLGLGHDEVVTWAKLGSGGRALEASIPVAPGFRALIAPRRDATSLTVERPIEAARREFEGVIVDCPSWRAEETIPEADVGVLVIPPTAPGVARASRFLDRFPATTWALVLNRLGPGSDLTRRRLEQRLGRAVTLEIPCSAMLRDAEDRCSLLSSPWSRWTRRVDRLCEGIFG